MEGTQFLVQWDEHPSHLATRLGYLLEHQSLVDVTLMCNTHTLKVHRAVLAACSPYFERQLGNHPLIVLKDMQFSVLKSLVEFMYCGETSVSEDNLTPLLEAAKFFEVKGLSSMTKESVCAPSSPLGGLKPFPNMPFPTTSTGYGRGGGGTRGRGRGRGRPPLSQVQHASSSAAGSPTESAQILLSLSGGTTAAAGGGGGSPSSSSTSSSAAALHHLATTSRNVKIDPAGLVSSSTSADSKLLLKLSEPPRRRGRKRGAINTAFRDRMLESERALESLKRELTDDGDSPLLSSLLSKSSKCVDDEEGLTSAGYQSNRLASDVPILIDNGEGKLLSLSDATNKRSPIIPPCLIKTETEEHINDEVIENLKNGGLSEAELEPDAVVLFEVTDDKKVEKFVLSAKDVSMLKSLNEQLTKQKKELSDITKSTNVSTVDVAGTNTKIAELKLKIGKTKSILSQFVHLKEKLKNFLPNGFEETNTKKAVPEIMHLEFVDGNGEKIVDYDLRGTIEEKRITNTSKEQTSKDGEFLRLFDMVCGDATSDETGSPMLSENTLKKLDRREDEMLQNDSESKEMSYQLVLDDQNENISYDQIEAMMNETSNNIVIEEKTPDLKYIIDNDGNIMNQDENYVVYESENVIYDNPESILPDVSEGENSNNYVVPDRSIENEGSEYIVEYNEKTDLNDEIKELNDRSEYIVYNENSKDNFDDDNNYNSTSDHNFDSTQDGTSFGSNHTDHTFVNAHSDTNFESHLEVVNTADNDCSNFVIYDVERNDADDDMVGVMSGVQVRTKGEVGLVPLKEALEKFQVLGSGKGRTSSSMNGEAHLEEAAVSPEKRRRVDSED